MSSKIALGVDIGGTNTKIALVSEQGVIISSLSFPTQPGDANFTHFLHELKAQVTKLFKAANKNINGILGIGIGAPNANFLTGKIESPTNLKSWGSIDLKTAVENLFQKEVMIENDANIAALGELYWGKGKNKRDFVVLTLGTGVGCGIIANNSLVRGHAGLASEAGHIIIRPNGRKCGCGGYGHLEMYCSTRGMEITLKEKISKEVSFREMVALYHEDDKDIIQVIHETAKDLGVGLATLGSTLLPKYFILAGGGAALGQRFAQEAQKHMNELIYPPFRERIEVLISDVSKGNGAVLGAASLIFFEKTNAQ